MKETISFSLVIPAYNEERKIKKDIEAAFAFFKRHKINAEVIVSTDGIKDRTNDIVLELKKTYPTISLITKKNKIGKGAALKAGVLAAKGEIIMFADAGLCVPYKYAEKGIKLLEKGFDAAFASRAEKDSVIVRKQPLYRQIGSRIFGMIVRTLMGIPKNIRDTQCGFKLYKRAAALHVFGELESKGMSFDIEVILRLKKHNYKMSSFGVEWQNDIDTKFNPVGGTLHLFKELYAMKVKYLI